MMPELDGPGLIRRIRSAQRPGYVYAMLVTAKSQKEDLVEGMEAGADDFLTKPFDRDELRVRLRAGERIIRLEQNVRETKVALIQTEKLASLGRLAAGVAHEINNPLAFVVNNLAVLRRDVLDAMRVLDKYREGGDMPGAGGAGARRRGGPPGGGDRPALPPREPPPLFESSAEGLRRVRAIVQNLRDFARLDEAEFKEVDVNAALRSTLEVLRHESRQEGDPRGDRLPGTPPGDLPRRQGQSGLPEHLAQRHPGLRARGADRGPHPARRRGRRARGDRRPRQRDPPRAPAAHLRALLHDEAGRCRARDWASRSATGSSGTRAVRSRSRASSAGAASSASGSPCQPPKADAGSEPPSSAMTGSPGASPIVVPGLGSPYGGRRPAVRSGYRQTASRFG